MSGGVEPIRDGFGVDVEPLVGFGGGVVDFWATLVFECVIVAFLKKKKGRELNMRMCSLGGFKLDYLRFRVL